MIAFAPLNVHPVLLGTPGDGEEALHLVLEVFDDRVEDIVRHPVDVPLIEIEKERDDLVSGYTEVQGVACRIGGWHCACIFAISGGCWKGCRAQALKDAMAGGRKG